MTPRRFTAALDPAVCTLVGNGRCDVYTIGDLERARRERLTREELQREAGLPLPDEEVDAHLDRGGLDPLDGPPEAA